MTPLGKTIILLIFSNIFMLSAWYVHLKEWNSKPWYIAALLSWGIAFFEYSVHIPANRIGSTVLTLSQLQILQVGMSLIIFIPFTIIVMKQPITTDYLVAGCFLLCAAYFIFRGAI